MEPQHWVMTLQWLPVSYCTVKWWAINRSSLQANTMVAVVRKYVTGFGFTGSIRKLRRFSAQHKRDCDELGSFLLLKQGDKG
mmetsp:Transcript_25807/g.37785  ORF Transcript_25807/g.37785 Transcript_25807/m.37785 type:complete len:82 (+) Transcript_25807:1154-1399(+)